MDSIRLHLSRLFVIQMRAAATLVLLALVIGAALLGAWMLQDLRAFLFDR